MKRCIDRKLTKYIVDNWEDRTRAQEVQDMLEAIVVELKSDLRDFERRHRMTDEECAHWESLIADVPTREFWEKIDHMLDFSFDF